jgi:hypothetical protein
MTVTTLLIIILVLMLVGGPYVQRDGTTYFGAGPNFGGLLGVVLIIILVLFVSGRL